MNSTLDVRVETTNKIQDLLAPFLANGEIVELEDACWSRAKCLAFSSGDVDRIYVQACRDAVSNLCQSDLNNGNAGLCDAIKAAMTGATPRVRPICSSVHDARSASVRITSCKRVQPTRLRPSLWHALRVDTSGQSEIWRVTFTPSM
jgi:hypothetical protein